MTSCLCKTVREAVLASFGLGRVLSKLLNSLLSIKRPAPSAVSVETRALVSIEENGNSDTAKAEQDRGPRRLQQIEYFQKKAESDDRAADHEENQRQFLNLPHEVISRM